MGLTLNDFFDGKALIPYLAKKPKFQYLFESILPYQPTSKLQYEHIVGKYKNPIEASFVAFGNGAPTRGRDGVAKFTEKLRPIKLEMKLDGELFINYKENGKTDPMFDALFDDVGMVYDGVRVRTEKMRIEVLTTGALSVNENGVAFPVDYAMPEAHKITHDGTSKKHWTDLVNSNPIADMIEWMNAIDFTPAYGVVSKKLINYILQNENTRKAIYGSTGSTIPVSSDQLNDLLLKHQLPALVIDDDKYRDVTGAEQKFFPESRILWLGSNLGNTLMGPTEEGALGKNIVKTDSGIYVQVYENEKPVGIYTTASATSLVALPGVNEILTAKVTA